MGKSFDLGLRGGEHITTFFVLTPFPHTLGAPPKNGERERAAAEISRKEKKFFPLFSGKEGASAASPPLN